MSNRRAELIYKRIFCGGLTAEEALELERLTDISLLELEAETADQNRYLTELLLAASETR